MELVGTNTRYTILWCLLKIGEKKGGAGSKVCIVFHRAPNKDDCLQTGLGCDPQEGAQGYLKKGSVGNCREAFCSTKAQNTQSVEQPKTREQKQVNK